jgi:F-type H+-transporting ATPase subunit delta
VKYFKKDLKTAKNIFESNLKNGKLDEAKLMSWVFRLRKLGPKKGLRILKALLKQVSVFYQKQTLVVESSEDLHPKYLDTIGNIFEEKLKKPLKVEFRKNEALVAGIKITIGDTVWDYSVNSSLESLKEVSRG